MSKIRKNAQIKRLNNNQLIQYLLKQVRLYFIERGFEIDKIECYLSQKTFSEIDLNRIKESFFERAEVKISDIFFTTLTFEYGDFTLSLLRKFEKITFQNCHFKSINISRYKFSDKLTFNQCVFYDQFSSKDNSIDFNYCFFDDKVELKSCKIVASNCIFKADVFIKKFHINEKLFINSIFENKLEVSHSEFGVVDFIEHNKKDDFIAHLEVHECKTKENINFKLNNFKINTLIINKTTFQSKFEIKKSVINKLRFEDSNVTKVFDAFDSKFEKAYFYKSIFNDFAAFENVKFGKKGIYDDEYITEFKYVTFESFSNFRNTYFHSGLDLSRSNFTAIQPPNFLDANVSQKNSTRETFRIIKKSFDTVGNKIEANRFFVQEMKAFKIEMERKVKKLEKLEFCSNFCLNYNKNLIRDKKKSLKKELFIFKVNDGISKFGNDYILPIVWLVFVIIIYRMIILLNETLPQILNLVINYILVGMLLIGLIYSMRTKFYRYTVFFILSSINLFLWFPIVYQGFYWDSLDLLIYLNNATINLAVYSSFLKSGIEFISLIFHIIFLILSWQIVVSIKRRVQR